jgi:hypothetical protein
MLEEEKEEKEEKIEVKQKIKLEKLQEKLEEKLKKKQELEIIRNYAKNCGFKECNTWRQINDCFAELQRKNNALMRDLHEDSSWDTIYHYDEYYDKHYDEYYDKHYDEYYDNINKYFNTYKSSKKKDLVPNKSYTNNYYYTCD